MSEPMPRAVIYARLSTAQTDKGDDEQSDSVENQLADLRKLADTRGFDVVREFVDDGISGYKGKYRPDFNALIGYVAAEDVEYILARHQDRLSRNEEEGYVIKVASIKHKVKWMFGSGMVVDPSTAEGELTAAVLQAISIYESRVKTYRLLQHYDGKRMSGTFQAPPGTFGYDKAVLVPDEARRIREAYEAIDVGKTMGSIVRQWNEEQVPQRKGGSHWTYAHIKSILRRPRNAGMVADQDGNLIEGLVGQWEAIVEPELWHRVNNTINDPARKTSPGFQPVSLGGGIAVCNICGTKMKSNTVSDKRAGTRYKILKCGRVLKDGTRHPSARVSDLDEVIREAIIDAFAFGPSNLFQEDDSPVLSLQQQLADLNEKRARVLDQYEDGDIDRAEKNKRLKKYDAPIESHRVKLDEAVAASASAHMMIDLREGFIDSETHVASYDGLAKLKEELGKRFDALDITQRRHLSRELLHTRVLGGRGKQKYRVIHRKVTSLNSDEDNELLAELYETNPT